MKSLPSFLFVSHTSGIGGAELAMVETMTGLLASGHRVHAVLPQRGPLEQHLNAHKIGYHIVVYDQWTGYGRLSFVSKALFVRGFVRSARGIARVAKQVKADVVVTNTSTTPVGALGAALASKKHIWHLHEFVEEDHGLNWYFGAAFSYSLISRLSNAIICTSQAVAEKARRVMPGARRLHTIYCACNMVAKAPFDSALKAPARLLMAGSISDGKNQLEAVEAVVLLEAEGVDVELRLVGNVSPAYGQKLFKAIEKLKRPGRIYIENFEADMTGVFDKADVFLMTSRMEAFGRVLVEAQKRGLPCIGPDAGGIPEILDNGRGLLYKPGDAKDLALQISKMIGDDALRNAIARRGHEYAMAHFGIKQNAGAFAALAGEVLA